jgi:hypothetical protein
MAWKLEWNGSLIKSDNCCRGFSSPERLLEPEEKERWMSGSAALTRKAVNREDESARQHQERESERLCRKGRRVQRCAVVSMMRHGKLGGKGQCRIYMNAKGRENASRSGSGAQ